MDFETLTFVDTPDFQCWIPSMNTLPAAKLMQVMLAGQKNDAAQQMILMMDLIRENLAPDLVDAFNELNVEQIIAVIGEWVVVSGGKTLE
jgi:hypothetical protein